MISKYGGHQINGWAVLQFSNVLVETVAHAVWESPEGELIDISQRNEKETLFLIDPNMVFNNNSIPNVRSALTSSPMVAEFIKLSAEIDRFKCSTSGNTYSIPTDLFLKHQSIQQILHTKEYPNALCPCKSGLKYKRCCGKQ